MAIGYDGYDEYVWLEDEERYEKLGDDADLSEYVQKDGAKVLSDNNYTTAEKNKLAGIPADATNNAGTITEIRMNGASKGTSGVIDLGTVLTEHQSLADYATLSSVNAKADATTVNALIGSDAGKSVRNIANEELTAQLIPANAQTALDTLQEIAAWIQNHPNDAAAINAKLTLGTNNGAEYATVKAYVEAATDGLINLSALSAAVSGNGNAITGVSYDNTTGAFSFTKGATFLTEHQDISGKVDKVTGKGLSTNDYTTAEKNKLSGIEAGANHTTIDAALSNAGQAADAKSVGDAIAALEAQNALLRGLVSRMEVYCTASGNPVTISDAAAANVKALSVTITPTQSGSGEPSPDNVRPIEGVSSVSVMRANTTRNLFDPSFLLRADGWSADASGVYFGPVNKLPPRFDPRYSPDGKGYPTAPFKPNTRYTFSADVRSEPVVAGKNTLMIKFYYTDGSDTDVLRAAETDYVRKSATSAAGKTVRSLSFSYANNGQAFMKNIQLEEGASETAYEPYRGQSAALPMTDGSDPLTVYGGALELSETETKLTVTHGNIASYNGETVPDGWISSTGQLSTGAQVVYPLATPPTYQLAPAQLTTLPGYNVVSADAGTIELTYRADVALSLEDLT